MLRHIKSIFNLLTQRPNIPDKERINELIKIILNRRSCRAFTEEDIDDDDFNLILEAGRFAPSTANLQTWSFITFTRNEWRKVFDRPIPFNGARAIVICADSHRNKHLPIEFPHTPFVNGTFSVFNAGLAAMNMNITAESLGIRSIMLSDTGMTGLLDFLYLKEHLSLPADVIPITTLVLGRSHTPGPVVPPRINRDAVVMRNAYREPPQEILEEWFDRMKVGFILLYPFAGLSSKISYYHERMETAERELRGIFLEERE